MKSLLQPRRWFFSAASALVLAFGAAASSSAPALTNARAVVCSGARMDASAEVRVDAGAAARTAAHDTAYDAAHDATRVDVQAETAPLARAPVDVVRVVPASAADVWDAWTSAAGLRETFGFDAALDLRIGGKYEVYFYPDAPLGERGTETCTVLAYDPRRMLSFSWGAPRQFEHAHRRNLPVVLELDALDATHTRVELVHHGFDARASAEPEHAAEWTEVRAYFERAWSGVLDRQVARFAPSSVANERAPIELGEVVHAPREAVWSALTTEAGWRRTLGAAAEIELAIGGKFELRFDPNAPPGQGGSEGCNVLSFVPQRMLSFSWNAPPKFAFARGQRTWVVVTLTELDAQSTRVRLVHHGFEERAQASPEHAAEFSACRAYFAQAWPKVLGALQHAFDAAPQQPAAAQRP